MLQRTNLHIVPADMNICNMEIRGVDSVVTCEKIKLATDLRFSCYDRQEEGISLMILHLDCMRLR